MHGRNRCRVIVESHGAAGGLGIGLAVAGALERKPSLHSIPSSSATPPHDSHQERRECDATSCPLASSVRRAPGPTQACMQSAGTRRENASRRGDPCTALARHACAGHGHIPQCRGPRDAREGCQPYCPVSPSDIVILAGDTRNVTKGEGSYVPCPRLSGL